MYLVFWVSKVMLYPIALVVIDAALEFSIKGGDPKAALRDVFIRFSIMITVFLLGARLLYAITPVLRWLNARLGTKDASAYKEKYVTNALKAEPQCPSAAFAVCCNVSEFWSECRHLKKYVLCSGFINYQSDYQ